MNSTVVLINLLNSVTNFNAKMNKLEELKDKNNLRPTSTSNLPVVLKKAKSVLNLNTKNSVENKPPPKQNLRRSKTSASIATRAIKRPARNVTVHTEVKKPFIKPTVKSTTVQRNAATSTSNNVSRTTENSTVKKTQNTGAVKLCKWDLKGRLAHATNELSNLRQEYKEAELKLNSLQIQVNTSEANVNLYKSTAFENENLNKALNNELNELKAEMAIVQEQRDDLSKRLKESEESFKIVSESLKEFKEKCISQEAVLLRHTSEVTKLQTDLEIEKQNNKELSTMKNELQSLVHTMDMDRRVLHNALQELKGNIRVFCRIRPRTLSELKQGKGICAMNFVDECTIEVGKMDESDTINCSGKKRGTRQEFSFDKVFPPNTSQEDIFEELALLVQSALEGYNVCVFAYGQTGSGKTYTMEGLPGIDTEGMIPRTVRHIYKEMTQYELLGWEYRIEASFLEIYNEHIVDLLDSQTKTHEIRMTDSKGHDLYVSNLKVQEIHSPEELQKYLLIAQHNRAVAATLSNERSSRSHSVARIKLIGTHKTKKEVTIGNLNLVDLAGSERLKGEGSARMVETKNINKSLANLSNVILALLKKQEHIPYRNSKLTHLLMPSLGGNSKTLMLLNISPLDECYNETLNSLRFGSNVNSCKTGNVKRLRTVLQQSI